MADNALTQAFSPQSNGGGVGGGIGAAVAAPINAANALGSAGLHATILGLLGFLILMWVLIRVARFRFVISTGVGR